MISYPLSLRAPAKINLFLHILGQKPNGYHELQTLFQFIDLYDELTFQPRHDGVIHFSCNDPSIPVEHQLVLKAAHLLQQVSGSTQGIDIHLNKHIPMGAGLGGGSSDAASTLVALNTLWDLHLSNAALQKLGLQLGADVPIFVYGHSAFASGVGEQLTAATPELKSYVIAKTTCHIQSAALFQHPQLTRDTPALCFDTYRYEETRNDCEILVRQLYPKIDAVCHWLSAYGSPRLTGTGACVFLPLKDPSLWPLIQAQCPKNCRLWLCQGLNQSPALFDLANNDRALAPDRSNVVNHPT